MSFRDALADGGLLLLDGGTGSELRRRGLALSDDCWSASVNLDHGALLEAIHRDYIAAGAEIVTANTFGTTRFVLTAAGLGDAFEAVNRAAIRAARDAATRTSGRKVLVAASLSCMPPRFDTLAYPAPDVEYKAYCELAALFADESVDVVLIEMLQSPTHAGLACRAVRATGLPFVAGLSCRLHPGRPDALVTFDDADLRFEPVFDAVLPFAPDAIAIMHSPVGAILPALDLLRTRWTGPIGAYAEIPYPEDPEGYGAARLPTADYADAAQQWIAAGARIVGGCCGTTPSHIAVLAALRCR